VDARKVQESHDALMADILKTLERRVATLLYLYDKEQWDLFVGVITSTDRLQHFFWDAIEDEGHKYHSAFRDYYRQVDRFLGSIAERLRDETFFIMSDHGFTRIEKQVYLNRWLIDKGYLKLKENARSIEDIAEGSVAFALDPGRVYINAKGRFPLGAVDAAGAGPLISEIAEGLSQISTNGRRVIKRVYRRDEVFAGEFLPLAPDLCAHGEYGFDLKGALNKPDLMDNEVFTGMHTQDDATLFINRKPEQLRPGRPHITDIAPSVLQALGLVGSTRMDGTSIVTVSE
jgi:predicted AlkP superfamily phosphohydrolase/phosphomutase